METIASEPTFTKLFLVHNKPSRAVPFIEKFCKVSTEESAKRLQGLPVTVGNSNNYQLALSAVKKSLYAGYLFDEAELVADKFSRTISEKQQQCQAEFQTIVGKSLQSASKANIIAAEKKRKQCSDQFAWDMDQGLTAFKTKGCDIDDVNAMIKLILSQRRKSYNVTDYTGSE